jgi:hypothetical protein
MSFLKYLSESENLPVVSIYEQLLPYKNNNSVFMCFSNVEKIEPHENITDLKSAVPYGIYAYPLKDMWKSYHIEEHQSISHLPYASKRPFISLFRYKHKIIDVNQYKDLEHDILTLDQRYGHIINLNVKSRIEQSKHPFMSLWSTTREIAYLLNPNNLTKQWNTILRNLGYGGFTDNSDIGILHHEPNQALILQLDNILPIKTILNKDYKHTKTELLKIHTVNDILQHLEKYPVKTIIRSIDGNLATAFQRYLENLNNNGKLDDFLSLHDDADSKLLVLIWLNDHVSFKNVDHQLIHYFEMLADIPKVLHFAQHVAKYPWNIHILQHNLELAKAI